MNKSKTNIILYTRDGTGRDSYISYNDGGFWKDNDQKIKLKPKFPFTPSATQHSFRKNPTPLHYHSDGFGRDSYIFHNNGGLTYGFTPLSNCKLQCFLRNYQNIIFNSNPNSPKIKLSKTELKHKNLILKIQQNVIKRLYENEKFKFFKKNDNLSFYQMKKMNLNSTVNNFNKNNSAKEIFYCKKNYLKLPIKLQLKKNNKIPSFNSSNSAPNIYKKNNNENYEINNDNNYINNNNKIRKIIFDKKLRISNNYFTQKDFFSHDLRKYNSTKNINFSYNKDNIFKQYQT